jgi:5-formyltetrahydrofolate cyclo-ligase
VRLPVLLPERKTRDHAGRTPLNQDQDKSALRKGLRALRAAVPAAGRRDAARRAARFAARLPPLRRARRVALYLAVRSELGTAPLLAALLRRGVHLYLPRLAPAGMQFVRIHRHSPLRPNGHGIRQPLRGPRCSARRLDVILLPLVAFDRRGTRLGAGGGHYDRALARRPPYRRPLRVGYAYALQCCDELPREPWDVRLDAVITDRGVWRWRTG